MPGQQPLALPLPQPLVATSPALSRHIKASEQIKLNKTKQNTHTPHTHTPHTRLLSAFFQSFFAAASSPQVAATAAPAEDEAAPLECTHTQQRCRLCVCVRVCVKVQLENSCRSCCCCCWLASSFYAYKFAAPSPAPELAAFFSH